MRFLQLIFILPALLAGGCSIFSGDDEDADNRTENLVEKELYDRAISALSSNQSRVGIEYLQAIEAQFPFGNYAEQAQLELIYGYYRSADYDAAMAAAERFIRLHPDHPNVDYAYYMRGVITFSRDSSIFGQYFPIDITKRDPGSARDSYAHFSELLLRFPDSAYGADTRKRLIYLRNLLARREINVANYYFERGAYLSATNRGRFVVENFQGSPAVADGLAVMAQGYLLLGYDDLAQNSISVLQENFPEHPALDEDGNFVRRQELIEQKPSWLNRLSLGFLDSPEPIGYDTRELYNTEYSLGTSNSDLATAIGSGTNVETYDTTKDVAPPEYEGL